jgi:hypothetical protein
MKVFSQYGAMYAELSESDVIEKKPVELGDGVLLHGEWVKKLGEKKRSSFSMSDGYYLRYAGMVYNTLLFDVNHFTAHPLYYAFHYIDSGCLVLMSGEGSGWDLRIKHLVKFTEINDVANIHEQLELFQ